MSASRDARSEVRAFRESLEASMWRQEHRDDRVGIIPTSAAFQAICELLRDVDNGLSELESRLEQLEASLEAYINGDIKLPRGRR